MAYSKELAGIIKKAMDQLGLKHYDFDGEKGTYTYTMSIDCKLKSSRVRVRVRADDYIVYYYCPMNADDCKPQMAEFLTRANYGLTAGNFEMDWRDGEIRFKSAVNCEEEFPSVESVKKTLVLCEIMMERYGNGIVAVMFGMSSPEDAVNACEEN